jgi:hypothetical protein
MNSKQSPSLWDNSGLQSLTVTATSSYVSHIPLGIRCSHRRGALPKRLFRNLQILLTAAIQRADCLQDHQHTEHAAEVVEVQVKCAIHAAGTESTY